MASQLLEQRSREAQEYKALSVRKERGAKISGFTNEEILRLEDLYQLALNGEFGRQNRHEDLVFLRNAKAARVKQRVEEGKPPFEETYFRGRWEWDPIHKCYDWKAEEGNNPSDFGEEGLLWEPRELRPPISPEQENTRI